tara:strand:+ start:71 stop:808 length:738 start_codon:yes stop_codon:yes gene_type:complete
MLLNDTPLEEDITFDKYKMVRKYRVVPRGYGIYFDNRILEIERVCVQTKDLSFEDYVFLRGFHFVINSFYNSDVFHEMINYLKSIDISIYKWLFKIHESLREDGGEAGELYMSFLEETRSELWNSKEELLIYYDQDDNYQKLIDEVCGANLLQKYYALFLLNIKPFISLVDRVTEKNYHLVNNNIVKDILKFSLLKRGNIFDDSLYEVVEEFGYDLLEYSRKERDDGIANIIKKKIVLKFYVDEE